MIARHLAVLRMKNLRRKYFHHVETNDPRQAAAVAAEHWLSNDFDLTSAASILVYRYQTGGQVDPTVLFRLRARALERKQQKAVGRRNELRKWRQSMEASRRAAIQRMEQHLASGQVAEAELDALKSQFEGGELHGHPKLQAHLWPEGPPSLHGAGTLLFRELANHGAWLVSRSRGGDGWQVWLDLLVGYLLQHDDRGEFIAKGETVSNTADSETRIGETYSIKDLHQASALCCAWLRSRVAVRSAEPGKAPRKPVRCNSRYEAIDNVLRSIAETRPRNHEEVFRALEGRSRLPNAKPFKSAGGWAAGFRADNDAAHAWLSKRWSQLGLPPFLRGPKK